MGKKTTFLKICLAACILLWSDVNLAQHLSMVNVAGNGTIPFVEGSDALETGFDAPTHIAIDDNGDIYFSVIVPEFAGKVSGVYKIDAETKVINRVIEHTSRLSGLDVKDGVIYFSFGTGNEAYFNPEYIYYINPLTPDVIDTLAGNGEYTEAINGSLARESPIGNAGGLKISPDGNFLYYSSTENEGLIFYNYIQKISLNESDVRTYRVAGQAEEPVTEVLDGTDALLAKLDLQLGLAWDSEGNLYFATKDSKIKMKATDGNIYHVAGNGGTEYDPTQTEARTASLGINASGFDIISSTNQLVYCDKTNNRLRMINLQAGTETDGETIQTIGGTGFEDGEGDASNDLGNLSFKEAINVNIAPRDVAVTANGIFFTDLKAYRIRRVFPCKNPEILVTNIDKDEICKGDEVTMTFDGELNDGLVWKWFDEGCNEGVIPGENGESLTVTADESKTYYVIGTGGCTNNETCAEFKLDVTCKEYFNTFTPNGDGVNDFLEIPVLDNFPTNTVVVYNRWGQLLEQIENYDNLTVVWQGTNGDNDPVDSGTYYFTAEANGELISSGWVQVIK